MRLIDADKLLDRCKFYHLPNGDLAVPIIDVQHAPTVEAPDINVGNMDTTTHDSIPAETGKNDGDGTSGDLISRTQAIDEIHEDAEWLASQGSDWQTERMERDKSILMSLPSVQPETNCSEIPNNSDTISRQAAIDALRKMQTYKLFAGDDMLLIDQAEAQTELMMLPSAQPEIIRCKDCKYYKYGICMKIGANKSFHGFCDWAERGEQE